MPTVLYVLLALAVVGALAYAVHQVTVRQRRILAEITRLERLTAEVTMSAEALLDEIDERMARLRDLAAQLEKRAAAELQARAQAEGRGGDPEAESLGGEARSGAAKERGEPAGHVPESGPVPEGSAEGAAASGAVPAAAVETPAAPPAGEAKPGRARKRRSRTSKSGAADRPGSRDGDAEGPAAAGDRYADLREAVWRLADEGKDAVAIAEALGVPRGEVLLMLNLRGRKAAR